MISTIGEFSQYESDITLRSIFWRFSPPFDHHSLIHSHAPLLHSWLITTITVHNSFTHPYLIFHYETILPNFCPHHSLTHMHTHAKLRPHLSQLLKKRGIMLRCTNQRSIIIPFDYWISFLTIQANEASLFIHSHTTINTCIIIITSIYPVCGINVTQSIILYVNKIITINFLNWSWANLFIHFWFLLFLSIFDLCSLLALCIAT